MVAPAAYSHKEIRKLAKKAPIGRRRAGALHAGGGMDTTTTAAAAARQKKRGAFAGDDDEDDLAAHPIDGGGRGAPIHTTKMKALLDSRLF